MKTRKAILRAGWFLLAILLIGGGAGAAFQPASAAAGAYKILAWNDLGMHCYNRDFADLAVLPPYNTLWVQVVKEGDPPELVTSGITVEYFYADNTYSVGKTNFWTYSQDLFGVALAPNVGLKGKGLSGTMDLDVDHFVAEGIPVTEFSDSAPTVSQPYQLATVVVKDAASGDTLATTQVVTPVSSEMRCDNCHTDNGSAAPENPTGKVETNILQLHDEENGTNLMDNRPVLCANCHASNALGMTGDPDLPNLSKAMHEKHSGKVSNTLDGCYNCHPGPQTKCLRDVMSVDHGMDCIDCHGGMNTVKNNPNPWLNEPRCDTCHDSGQYDQNHSLYRFSTEHGGLYCEACHDSTHAIAPSREVNDSLKFITLQGKNGPIDRCQVCHTTVPATGTGPHGITVTGPIFEDVPSGYWAQNWIERLYTASVTGGCGTTPLIYCPEAAVTRAQMAVFIERSLHGSAFTPPTNVSLTFGDISAHWARYWIQALVTDGITGGCGEGNYCPNAPVTRAEMAVFLLRALHGNTYSPPPATGTMFDDVSADYWAAAWIEQLATEGITGGCGGNNYCPQISVSRAQMAVFLVPTFSIP
ncbi:MAG: S-layer homology domain-containing protein [Chloroflexota bacterium]